MKFLSVDKSANYYDILTETLFPSFICSCSINVDPKNVTREIYQIKDEHSSVHVSNEGGYHSPYFVSTQEEEYQNYTYLKNVLKVSCQFVDDLLFNYLKVEKQVKTIEFWSIINKAYDYNVLHLHPHTDLVGVYYASVPENCGNLVVVRDDSLHAVNLGAECRKEVKAEEGKLYVFPSNLFHYVMANLSDEDRISIAFNFILEDL